MLAACSGSTGTSGVSGRAASLAGSGAIAGLDVESAGFAAPKTDFAGAPKPAAAARGAASGGGRYQVGKPYQIAGKWYRPEVDAGYDRVGPASWYGGWFNGRSTANGEVFDAQALSAAHPTLPLPSYVRVTNLENDRSIVVRVNDRGPYARSRMLDVSERTAELLGFKHDGTTDVRVQYVDRAPLEGDDEAFLLASYRGPDADMWGGAQATVASAEPRRRARERRAGALAQVAAPRLRMKAPRPTTAVAFASGGSQAAEEGEVVFQAVSEPYEPTDRIQMAFEMASQAEY